MRQLWNMPRIRHPVSLHVGKGACEHLGDWREPRWALIALGEEHRRGELCQGVEIGSGEVGVAQLAQERWRVVDKRSLPSGGSCAHMPGSERDLFDEVVKGAGSAGANAPPAGGASGAVLGRTPKR